VNLKRALWCVLLFFSLAFVLFPAYSRSSVTSHPGFQVSTFAALNAGVYDGALTFAELKQHGDFGLGTFEGLDGELIAIDGEFYQIKGDGVIKLVTDDLKTPFSAVTFFQKEQSFSLKGKMTYQEFQKQMGDRLKTPNLPYAIRLSGVFPYLKVRSVFAQKTPYPPLSAVVKHSQSIFELRNVRGTLVGFRLPQYLANVNITGYHFHFISSDRRSGGHLLDGEFLNPIAEIETLRDWQIRLPNNAAFDRALLESAN
jgi:acetolactate decarboxylase